MIILYIPFDPILKMDSVSILLVSYATSGNSQQCLCIWERFVGESQRTEGTQKQKLCNSLYLIYEIKTLLMKKVHGINSVFTRFFLNI